MIWPYLQKNLIKNINILNESRYFKRLIFTIIYKKYISECTQKIIEKKKICEDPKTCSDFTSLFIKFSILKSMMITLHNSKMAMHILAFYYTPNNCIRALGNSRRQFTTTVMCYKLSQVTTKHFHIHFNKMTIDWDQQN